MHTSCFMMGDGIFLARPGKGGYAGSFNMARLPEVVRMYNHTHTGADAAAKPSLHAYARRKPGIPAFEFVRSRVGTGELMSGKR